MILVRSEERSVAPCDAGEQRARNLFVLLPHLSPLHFVSCVSQADSTSERREQVQVVYERCCGLDVHQKTVVGCRLLSQRDQDRRESDPCLCNDDQWAQRAWPLARGGTCGTSGYRSARASIGVPFSICWKAIMRSCWSMPSICTPFLDTKQIVRIASGLLISCATVWLAASFIPPKPIRELRDLVRTHTQLMQERNRHSNRIHKILETANSKLSSVVTAIVGKSARRMLEALIEGESDPVELAQLARDRMRPKIALLQQARPRHLEPHHRFLRRRDPCPSRFSEASCWATGAGSGRAPVAFWEKPRTSHDHPRHFSTLCYHSHLRVRDRYDSISECGTPGFVGGTLSWKPVSVQANVAMASRPKATATCVLFWPKLPGFSHAWVTITFRLSSIISDLAWVRRKP